MELLPVYIIKSSLAIAILYLFYWLFLRNETYFGWNRLYLLISIAISLAFPLIKFNFFHDSANSFIATIEPIIIKGYQNISNTIDSNNKTSILLIIYISGAVFYFLRFMSNMGRIYFLYARYPKVKFNGFTTVLIDRDISPFTFFNILFLSAKDYQTGKLDGIISHEKAHKEMYHSIDIILLELLTILQWFNPFAWLFRIAVRSGHEFMADNRVLAEGFSRVKYQKLLFEKTLGIEAFDLTSNFNYSLLKKRLKMMTKQKSKAMAKVKYLLSLPLMLLACIMLTIGINSSAQGITDDQLDVMAEYPTGMDGALKLITQNLHYPEVAAKNGVAAKIFVQFTVNEKGKVTDIRIARTNIMGSKTNEVVVVGYTPEKNTNIDANSVKLLEEEAIRVVKLLDDFKPAEKDGKKVKADFTFPIIFALQEK